MKRRRNPATLTAHPMAAQIPQRDDDVALLDGKNVREALDALEVFGEAASKWS